MFGGSGASNAYMLVYRQKKLTKEAEKERPKVPEYWTSAVASINEVHEQERNHYNKLKNQFDLIVQPIETHFSVDENLFVKYINEEEIEEQGLKIRCQFTDTIFEIKEKVRAALGIEADKKFDLIEVTQLQNKFCQLSNPMSEIDESKEVKDTAITHLSCWALSLDTEQMSKLAKCTTEEAFPISVKIRSGDLEEVRHVYSNMALKEFMTTKCDWSGLELAQMKLRLIEDTLTKRLDTQIYDKEYLNLPEDQRRLNTLKDLQVVHNAMLLLEQKDGSEIEEESQ